MKKPLLIGICGHPGSGKSTLQEVLKSYGILPQDDGAILREHCMQIANLSHDDVSTQDGKRKSVTIAGRDWQVRKLLGEYGNALEALLGPDAIPEIAIRRALDCFQKENSVMTVAKQPLIGYSFGSVRRNQGQVYRKNGGIVVEVIRPGVDSSGNGFDEYDRSLVDFTINNYFQNISDLEHAIDGSNLGKLMRAYIRD